MKKFTNLFAMLALLLAPAVAWSQDELLVANGTGTNSYIPVYGYWADAAQHNQVIYPADSLEDMIGGTISGMTFYMSSHSSNGAWGITVTISLGTTESTSLSGLNTVADLTQVWQGTWDGTSDSIEVEFDDAFTYEGDNLLLDIQTVGNDYGSSSFYGVSLTNASFYSYNTTSNTQNFLPKTKFDYVPGGGSICYKPKYIVISDLTNNGATISWTSPTEAGIGYAIFVGGVYVATTTDTFYTVTGYEANTTYSVQVKNVCGEGDSSSALNGSFKTLCANGNCEVALSGLSSYYGYAEVWQNGGMLAAPTSNTSVEICNGDSLIVLYHAGSSYSSSSITVTDVAGTNLVSSWSSSGHNTGDTILAVASGCPTCIPASNLNVGFITASGATFTWTANGDVSEWAVYINGEERADSPITDNSYTISDLGASTTYTFSVVAICESGVDSSASRSISFQTECDGYVQLPWSSDFEDLQTAEFPNCWVQVATGSSGVNTIFPSAYRWQPNAHNSQVYFEFESSHQETEVLALPRMENVSNLQLSFWASSTTNTNGFLFEAGVVEEDENGNYLFVPVDTIELYSGPAESWSSSYRIYNVLFNTYEGPGERLGLRTTPTGTSMYTLMIDDFSVIYAGSPVLGPMEGSYDANVGDTVEFSSTLMTGGEVEYEWKSQKVDAGEASFVDGNTDADAAIVYTAGGIDTVMVIASNDFGADTAMSVVYIVDRQPVSEFPYSTGFEDEDDVNWLTSNGNNGWFIGAATAADGQRSIYVSSDNGASNIYGTVITRAYAYRHIDFAEAGDYAISFDWKCNGGYSNYVRAYLADGEVNPTANSYTSSSWQALGDAHYGQTSWQTEQLAVSVDEGIHTLIFYWTNDQTINNPPAAVDNISIAKLTCSSVGNLEAHNVYAHGADIVWQPRSEETAWWVVVDEGEGYEVTSDSIHLDGFDGQTSHTVKVWAVCGEGDTSFVSTVGFTTTIACPAVSNIHATDIEATGATIEWTPGAVETAWKLVIGDGDTVDVTGDPSYTATGLDANTVYNVTVIANCGDEDGTSVAATGSFRTGCAGGNCTFTVEMADSYGDGWNQNAINVYQNGELYESLTMTGGSSSTVTVSPCLGDPIALLWHRGNFPDEPSFVVKDNNDSVLLSVASNGILVNTSDGDTIMTFDGQCGATIVMDTTGTTPQPTTCDAPTALTATATETTVSISYSGSANLYQVGIVAGSTWNEYSATVDQTATLSYTFEGLTEGTQYTVAVRANCDNGANSTWTTTTVTTEQGQTPPEPCEVPTGLQTLSVDSTHATIKWTAAGDETEWQLKVNDNEQNLVTATSTTYVMSNLTPSTQYRVRVRAVCSANDHSDWSGELSFTTTASPADTTVGDTTGIAGVEAMMASVSPNPASTVVTVRTESEAMVSVVDMNGREVWCSDVAATCHRVDVSRMAKGAYFVRIVGEKGTAIRKLIVK